MKKGSSSKRRRHHPYDETLIFALACGSTVEAAASKAGVSKRTVYRRLDDPAFRKTLQTIRADMIYRATGMLTASSMEAVKTLLNLMNTGVGSTARLGAAKAILELGLKLRQAQEMEDRMAMIEERLAQSGTMNVLR